MKTEKWAGDGYTLKPCPLCGAEPEERHSWENGSIFWAWTIRCPECGLKIEGSHRYMNQENWNERTIGGDEPRYVHPMCPEEDEKGGSQMFKLTDLRGCIYYVPKKDEETTISEIVFEIRTAANRETKAGGPLWRKAYRDPELTQEVAVRTDQICLIEEVEND